MFDSDRCAQLLLFIRFAVGNERKFIIQPSQEVIDDALVGKNDLGEAIKGIFGGGSDEKNQGNADDIIVSETNEAKSNDDSEKSEGSSDVAKVDMTVEQINMVEQIKFQPMTMKQFLLIGIHV